MSTGALAGRGALVTGGGRGIGAAIAGALAAAGAAVVVSARGAAEVDQVARTLVARGAHAWALTCDVGDEAAVRALGERARELLGSVDIVINNAGVSGSAPLARLTLGEWERMLRVNATGTFLSTREFAPAMVTHGWGRVVNIASRVGLEGGRYVSHYSAAKHAVIGFTRSVALELAGSGVTINAVCPGYVDTPMTEATLDNVQSRTGLARPQALAAVLASGAQARLVTPDEVAAAVLALCRDDAAATNGTTVVLDGSASG